MIRVYYSIWAQGTQGPGPPPPQPRRNRQKLRGCSPEGAAHRAQPGVRHTPPRAVGVQELISPSPPHNKRHTPTRPPQNGPKRSSYHRNQTLDQTLDQTNSTQLFFLSQENISFFRSLDAFFNSIKQAMF